MSTMRIAFSSQGSFHPSNVFGTFSEALLNSVDHGRFGQFDPCGNFHVQLVLPLDMHVQQSYAAVAQHSLLMMR